MSSTTTSTAVPTDRPPAQLTTTTSSSSSSSTARPPVEIHPTAHLDPGAYVRGTHAISLGPGVLVHPRAMLVSVHGPLIINDGTVIMEKCVIGGPVPDPPSSTPVGPNPNPNPNPDLDSGLDLDSDRDPVKTVLGANVLVQAHAQIHAGASVGEAATVEAHAVVGRTGRVGAHAKVCGGAVVTDGLVVGEWEVVFASAAAGNQRRRKRVPLEAVERARLRAMQKDREATIMVLRASGARGAPVLRKR